MKAVKGSKWRHIKTDQVVDVIEHTDDGFIWIHNPKLDMDMILLVEYFLRYFKEVSDE